MEKAFSILQSTLVLSLFMSILLLGKMDKGSSKPTTAAPVEQNWQGKEVFAPLSNESSYDGVEEPYLNPYYYIPVQDYQPWPHLQTFSLPSPSAADFGIHKRDLFRTLLAKNYFLPTWYVQGCQTGFYSTKSCTGL